MGLLISDTGVLGKDEILCQYNSLDVVFLGNFSLSGLLLLGSSLFGSKVFIIADSFNFFLFGDFIDGLFDDFLLLIDI